MQERCRGSDACPVIFVTRVIIHRWYGTNCVRSEAGADPPRVFMNRNVGLFVVIAGGALVVLGLLIYAGALSWFGRLPGDIRYQGEHTRVYFPLVSSILISVLLTVLFYLLRRFF